MLSPLPGTLLNLSDANVAAQDNGGDDAGPRGQRGGDGGRGGRGGQRGGGGGMFGGGMMGGGMMAGRGGDPIVGLLRIEEVRKEIKVDEEQAAALKKMAESGRDEERPNFDMRNADEEQRRKFFAEMQAKQAERAEEMKMDLEVILLPEQMKRLEEISMQVRGMAALMDKDVIEKLKITEDQTKKMSAIREEAGSTMRDQMRELFSSGDRTAIAEKMKSMRDDIEKKVGEVLSADQLKQFETMKGEPFEMPAQGGFGGGGFRGGAGGGPGGPEGGAGGGRRGGGRPGGDDGGGRPGRPR